jgi:hypothetical protein
VLCVLTSLVETTAEMQRILSTLSDALQRDANADLTRLGRWEGVLLIGRSRSGPVVAACGSYRIEVWR